MVDFGWSYPSGCTDNDIDAHAGSDDNSLEAYQEWAGEAHQHLTNIFGLVTKLVANGKLQPPDATDIFAEVILAQDWLTNITGGQNTEISEHQKE